MTDNNRPEPKFKMNETVWREGKPKNLIGVNWSYARREWRYQDEQGLIWGEPELSRHRFQVGDSVRVKEDGSLAIIHSYWDDADFPYRLTYGTGAGGLMHWSDSELAPAPAEETRGAGAKGTAILQDLMRQAMRKGHCIEVCEHEGRMSCPTVAGLMMRIRELEAQPPMVPPFEGDPEECALRGLREAMSQVGGMCPELGAALDQLAAAIKKATPPRPVVWVRRHRPNTPSEHWHVCDEKGEVWGWEFKAKCGLDKTFPGIDVREYLP